jgi:hypothetical protein
MSYNSEEDDPALVAPPFRAFYPNISSNITKDGEEAAVSSIPSCNSRGTDDDDDDLIHVVHPSNDDDTCFLLPIDHDSPLRKGTLISATVNLLTSMVGGGKRLCYY